MGFHTIAIARGQEKAKQAKDLGADLYIDSQNQDPGAELAKIGGAKVILSTVTNSKAMSAVVPGLSLNGKLMLVGASNEPIKVSPLSRITTKLSIVGWPSGSTIDSEDTMAFCAHTGVRSMNVEFPLERAAEAYELMISGKARFRVVLKHR